MKLLYCIIIIIIIIVVVVIIIIIIIIIALHPFVELWQRSPFIVHLRSR
jgi:hypothetical protein